MNWLLFFSPLFRWRNRGSGGTMQAFQSRAKMRPGFEPPSVGFRSHSGSSFFMLPLHRDKSLSASSSRRPILWCASLESSVKPFEVGVITSRQTSCWELLRLSRLGNVMVASSQDWKRSVRELGKCSNGVISVPWQAWTLSQCYQVHNRKGKLCWFSKISLFSLLPRCQSSVCIAQSLSASIPSVGTGWHRFFPVCFLSMYLLCLLDYK